jgi:hypothetical protein
MTGVIVNLDDHRAHETGHAGCRACKYRYVAVAPVARERGGMECPRCSEHEVFFERDNGTLDDSEDRPECLQQFEVKP